MKPECSAARKVPHDGKTVLEQAKPDVEKFCYVLSGRVWLAVV